MSNFSTETVNITLKQRIKNQECRTVTNDYLCDDCVLRVVKEWLEQKIRLIKQDTKDSFPDDSDLPHNIGRVMELEDLIEELSL